MKHSQLRVFLFSFQNHVYTSLGEKVIHTNKVQFCTEFMYRTQSDTGHNTYLPL